MAYPFRSDDAEAAVEDRGARLVLRERAGHPRGEHVEHHDTDVVAVALVGAAGVAQADDEPDVAHGVPLGVAFALVTRGRIG